MNEERYKKITKLINSHKYGGKILNIFNYSITSLIYLVYPILLIVLAHNRDIRFWRVLFVPGISFILVSVFRNYYNTPRPYEIFNITPILKKKTKGKSFPSRHVFSIFIIGMAFYYINNMMGIAIMLLGFLLGIIRVLGGVHFPKDVIVGAVTAIIFGIVGFFLFCPIA